jgi:hypothetical protein
MRAPKDLRLNLRVPRIDPSRDLQAGGGFHLEGEGREEEGQVLAMLGISDRRFQISDSEI